MIDPRSQSPRVRVAALIVLDGRVVTVRHRLDNATYHLLPGGGVSWGETLEDALIREVVEETGLVVELDRLAFVNDTISPDARRHVVNLTFQASVVGGSITEHPDDPRVEAVDLFEPSSLADLDLRPPIANEIARLLEGEHTFGRYLGSIYSESR